MNRNEEKPSMNFIDIQQHLNIYHVSIMMVNKTRLIIFDCDEIHFQHSNEWHGIMNMNSAIFSDFFLSDSVPQVICIFITTGFKSMISNRLLRILTIFPLSQLRNSPEYFYTFNFFNKKVLL